MEIAYVGNGFEALPDYSASWPLGVYEDGPERSNHIVQAAV